MSSTNKRIIILVVAIALIAAILACSPGTLLSRTQPTSTPTKTPKPTFTATPIPTETPLPTDTPTPTATPTNTPLPTNTPIVFTATPTEIPTDTPTPIPTDTPRPTPRPTSKPKPKPTATTRPQPTTPPQPQFPWTGQVSNTMQNCGLTRVFGFILDSNGGLAGDQWLHYWADGWEGAWAKSQWTDFGAGTSWKGDEGNWDGTIDTRPRDGVWHVCVVSEEKSWNCVSNTVDAATSFDCNTGFQVIHITFKKN